MNDSLRNIKLDNLAIREKILYHKQRVQIINLLFLPKIAFRMNVIKYDEKTLNEINETNKKAVAHGLQVQWRLKDER